MRILLVLLVAAFAGTGPAAAQGTLDTGPERIWLAQSGGTVWRTRNFGPNGRSAFAMSANRQLRIAYRCTAAGRATLLLSGPALSRRPANDNVMMLLIDRNPTQLRVRKEPDGWVATIAPDGSLVRALRAGNFVSALDGRNRFYGRVSLRGSSSAIRSAQSFCGII